MTANLPTRVTVKTPPYFFGSYMRPGGLAKGERDTNDPQAQQERGGIKLLVASRLLSLSSIR